MPNNISNLGLVCSGLSWSSTSGQTVLTGTTNCVTLADQPQGVLLRRVGNISEALSVGGLYLYEEGDPSNWWFAVGLTLVDFLDRKKIGKVESRGVSGVVWQMIRRVRDFGSKPYSTGNNATIGGDLHPVYGEADQFAGKNVVALGLVSGATEGRGRSTAPGGYVAVSYMSTLVPMNGTFAQFISSPAVKARALELVPNDLKGYYDRTFADTLDAYAGKNKKPSLAVTTFWNGQNEVGVPIAEPRQVYVLGAYPRSLDNNIYWPEGISGLNANGGFDGTVGSATLAWNLEGSSFSGSPINESEQVSPKVREMELIGRPHLWPAGWQGPVIIAPGATTTFGDKQVGEVGGMKVGYLRDFHVLKRSLVDGMRYALDDSSEGDLPAMINKTFGDPFDASRVPTTSAAGQEATLENQLNDILVADVGRNRIMQQRGSLPEEIERFNDAWDAAAKALAKAES